MVSTAKVTAEELACLDDEHRYDLIEGELLKMSPAGGVHGLVGWRLTAHLSPYILNSGIGFGFNSETGFLLRRDPDTVLAPDFAFVRADRMLSLEDHQGFLPIAPDMVVEIVSPSERQTETNRKVSVYLEAGVREVWTVHPDRKQVIVYRQDEAPVCFAEDQEIDGGDVLPGFVLAVTALFEHQ